MTGNRIEEHINGCKIVKRMHANGNTHVYLLQPDGRVIGQVLRDRLKADILFSDYCNAALTYNFNQSVNSCQPSPFAVKRVNMNFIPHF